jgi:hypothetical protein
MKANEGMDVQIHIFLTSALVGGEWSAPGSHWVGGWVGPRAGLDGMEKKKFWSLPGLKLQPLSCPACSQLLYRVPVPVPVQIILLLMDLIVNH